MDVLAEILKESAPLSCNRWGGGDGVRPSSLCGTLGTRVKNSIHTHHNVIPVSMPTQPHMGEAYTLHRRWKHGGGIITGVTEMLKQ